MLEQLSQTVSERLLSDIHLTGHFLHFNFKGRWMRRAALTLLREEGPMPQKALQQKLGIKSGTISEMLLKMEQEELLDRIRDEHDRRGIRILVTERGLEELDRLNRISAECSGMMTDCLTESQITGICEALEAVYAHWKSLEASGFFEPQKEVNK